MQVDYMIIIGMQRKAVGVLADDPYGLDLYKIV